MNQFEILFVVFAFLFQIVLITHFSLRKWRFDTAIRYGWIVYGLSLAAAAVSLYLLVNRQTWELWTAGFLYLIWAAFGYIVEYCLKIDWRNPPRWLIFIPYILLYLATVMFYWWPLINLWKPLWYVYTVLFILTTWLNITSHKKNGRRQTN